MAAFFCYVLRYRQTIVTIEPIIFLRSKMMEQFTSFPVYFYDPSLKVLLVPQKQLEFLRQKRGSLAKLWMTTNTADATAGQYLDLTPHSLMGDDKNYMFRLEEQVASVRWMALRFINDAGVVVGSGVANKIPFDRDQADHIRAFLGIVPAKPQQKSVGRMASLFRALLPSASPA